MRAVLAALALLVLAPLAPAPGAADGLDRDGDRVDDALAGLPGPIPVRVLVEFESPPGLEAARAVERAGGVVVAPVRVLPILVVDAPATLVPALAGVAGVARVEADRELRPLLDASRALVLGDVAQREFGVTGRGVTIAILDTGVDTTHPDLASRIVASYDASLPDGVPRQFIDVGVPVVPRDADGHGTHVAGIAAGSGAESGGRYVGLAPGAGIANVKVFDGGGNSSSSDVLTAIDWVLGVREELGIRVMTMSLGGRSTDGSDALSRAIGVASDAGVLTVAAAGNDGPGMGSVGFPGVAPRALTVGAVDKNLDLAEFSGRGPTPDGRGKPEIVAPGVAITSTVPPSAGGAEYYAAKSGTSMAAPHAAGVAALLFEANASLTPAMAKWIMVATSRNLDRDAAWDPGAGWGLLDARAAVRAAENPSVLGAAPHREKAWDVPFDGPVSDLEKLDYQAGRVRRLVGVDVALAALALGFAAAAGRGRRWA